MKADLKTVGLSIPIAVTFMVTELDCAMHDASICPVSMFDWVGFDCYAPWDVGCNGVPIPTMISWLKDSLLSSQQRMTWVPSAYEGDRPNRDDGSGDVCIECAPPLQTEGQIIELANKWMEEVISNSQYVAVLPFRWRVMLDPRPPGYSPPYSPFLKVKQRMYQIARWLVHPEGTTVFPVKYDVSGLYNGTEACFAFDENVETSWNSGGSAPQGIIAYLPGSTRVSKIVLIPEETPPHPGAPTVLSILGRDSSGNWVVLPTSTGLSNPYSGLPNDRDVLTWVGTWDVNAILVQTQQAESWVAWREIQIFR